jgi:uncharacterized protein YjiS (DUF1127 family)
MFKRFMKAIERAQSRRVAYWQLSNLTDKDLKDIGLTRSDIRRVANR